MDKWEYTTVTLGTAGFLGGKFEPSDLDGKLNWMGQQGWELVSTFTTNKSYGETREIVSVFKRKK